MPVLVGEYNEDYLLLNSFGTYSIGDISGSLNGTKLNIDDASTQADISSGLGSMLSVSQSTGLYQIGDVDAAGNGTKMEIDDPNGVVQFTGNVGIGVAPTVLFQVQSGGNDFLSIDPTAGAEVSILKAYNTTGDDNVAISRLETSNTEASAVLGAGFNNAVKEGTIVITANTTAATLFYSADTHTFAGDAFLHRSGTTLDNGAAAAVGTLTNAPTAGDPTKWVAIDDNGTTRYIPTW